VLTYDNDNARTGQNLKKRRFTPGKVDASYSVRSKIVNQQSGAIAIGRVNCTTPAGAIICTSGIIGRAIDRSQTGGSL
jgi:hypothetical protein